MTDQKSIRGTYGQLKPIEADNWMVQDVMYELNQLAAKHDLRLIITHKNGVTYVGLALPDEAELQKLTDPDSHPADSLKKGD